MLDIIDTVYEEEVLKCNHNMPGIKLVTVNYLEGDSVGLFQVQIRPSWYFSQSLEGGTETHEGKFRCLVMVDE